MAMTLGRRIAVLVVAVLLAMMMVAGPALASPPAQANKGLGIAFVKSGGNSPPPGCTLSCE